MRSVAVRGVFVRFGGVQALDDVSLTLQGGAVTMLAGPNGAGKTTLIKVLLGLVRPDFGAFSVDDASAVIDNDWKSRIGYLPEAVAFSENMSGQQQLRFFARARGVDRGRVDAALERVGLYHARRRRVRGYSRGMRQRLGLAVATVASPELLILDEPTAGLDQEGLSVLWSVLDEWRDAGRSVLVSTHDLALMERRVDDICLLRSGRVLVQGTADDLRRAARLPHRVVFDVSDEDSAKVALLRDAMQKWGKGRVELVGDRLVVDASPDTVLELMTIQSGFPGVVRGLRVEEPTLDLVYERLIGSARATG
jgi:Cu-processing system ATP-binding protein